MKYTTIVVFTLLLVMFSHMAHSQKSNAKGIIYTTIVFSQGSLSYEYSLSPKHSIGLQGTVSAFWLFEQYEVFRRATAYYRFFIKKQNVKKSNLFLHTEFGYYDKIDHKTASSHITSDNISAGLLIGLRRFYGLSSSWFFDLALGANYAYSMPKTASFDSEHSDMEGYIPPEFPEDNHVFLPRLIIEIGYRF